MTTANLIELRPGGIVSSGNISHLNGYLTQLIGEPFRFARISYGDELTLHFGDLRPARSAKLPNHLYGAYILGVRGSPWILKPGSEALVVTAGINLDNHPNGFGTPIRKQDLESESLIQPESRVLSATSFVVKPVNGFGLQMRLSDGSTVLILPTVPEAEEPDEASLPELADWELASPNGLVSAGPGLIWSFKPPSNL
jgi:hypothetical protein